MVYVFYATSNRVDGVYWVVVRGDTGEEVNRFTSYERGRAWLTKRGMHHTDNMVGESRGELWTR